MQICKPATIASRKDQIDQNPGSKEFAAYARKLLTQERRAIIHKGVSTPSPQHAKNYPGSNQRRVVFLFLPWRLCTAEQIDVIVVQRRRSQDHSVRMKSCSHHRANTILVQKAAVSLCRRQEAALEVVHINTMMIGSPMEC
jgi:hypothetical protein